MMYSLQSTTTWLAGLLAILFIRCVDAASSAENIEVYSSPNSGYTDSVVCELAGLARIVKEADSLVSRGVSPCVGFNAFHVQGLLVTQDCFYVTSVDALRLEGWIFKLDRKTMDLLGKRQLAIGKDIHPGGIDFDGERIWVPVAAYRKCSHTHIMAVDPTTLEAKTQFQVDDHIGAVARSNDRLIGANWGAEQFYFWTVEGRLVAKKPSPTGIAYQDCKGCGDTIACLGGGYLDWIDVKRWCLVKRLPVGRSSSGASLSREGLGLFGDSVFFLPDDGPAARIYEYGFGRQGTPTSTQKKSAKTSPTTKLFVAPDDDDAKLEDPPIRHEYCLVFRKDRDFRTDRAAGLRSRYDEEEALSMSQGEARFGVSCETCFSRA